MIKYSLIFWTSLHLIPNTHSYTSTTLPFLSSTQYHSQIYSTIPLYAKTVSKKKKKSKPTSAKGGGFGAAPKTPTRKKSTSNDADDDYATFPPLDDKVKETLVPSTLEAATTSADLPEEIYARLGQIYGFPQFNYLDLEEEEEEEEEEEGGIDFGDLLSSDKPSSTSSSSSSDLLGGSSSLSSDFSDLIASASGDKGSTSTPATPKPLSKDLPISKLPTFDNFRVLHVDPLILSIDDFLTSSECDALIAHSDPTSSQNKMTNPTNMHQKPMMSRSKTVGKDSMSQAQRTSTTWFHPFQGVEIAPLLAKSCRLFGCDSIDRFEEPQTVRYKGSEKFTWHLDALGPSEELNKSGGQRTATMLVYLNSLEEGLGGNTMFRDLGVEGDFLKVPPKKGSALLFFPSAGGIPNTPFDIRTLHCGEAVSSDSPQEKWIAQLWVREKDGYSPTAPPGNTHSSAEDDIIAYCLK